MGYRVGAQYRTNPLSHKKTDKIVCVEKSNGLVLEYDNIQSPWAYIKAIKRANPNRSLKIWWYKDSPDNHNNIP